MALGTSGVSEESVGDLLRVSLSQVSNQICKHLPCWNTLSTIVEKLHALIYFDLAVFAAEFFFL